MVGLFVEQLHHTATEVGEILFLTKTSEKALKVGFQMHFLSHVSVQCMLVDTDLGLSLKLTLCVAVGGWGLGCYVGVCVAAVICVAR